MSPKDDKSVLGNLPSTRPARMSRRREGASARAGVPAAETATATKPKAAKATAAKPKAAKPKAAKAKPAKPTSKPVTAKPARPRPVRSGSPSLERPKSSAPHPPKPASTPPKGTEIVTTTVQAFGELAQIGFTLGGQVAKRALKRIPKP
jgi:hypothetical protein